MKYGRGFLKAVLFAGLILIEVPASGRVIYGQNIPTSAKELLLYSADENYKCFLDGRIPIDASLSIQKKLRILLDGISRRHYPDLPPIEILKTLKTKDGFVVILNLKEKEQDFFQSKWYQKFGGSLGWTQTYCQLISTSLQPDYPGFWFSGVKLLWNGKPLDEDVEIPSVVFRSEAKKRTVDFGINTSAGPVIPGRDIS